MIHALILLCVIFWLVPPIFLKAGYDRHIVGALVWFVIIMAVSSALLIAATAC